MDKRDICIVIPIYKEFLTDFEIKSVDQCIKILSDYSIHFICPKGLNVTFYKVKFPEINNYRFFDENYFKDLSGYNRLMLSDGFYKIFTQYSYMLVYQTDCYVFRDELLDWSLRGYDYIGGVWFDSFVGDPNLGAKLWYAGNGGLSLRKIKTMIRLLSSRKRLKNLKQLIVEKKDIYVINKFKFLKELFLLPLNFIGYKNNFNYQVKRFDGNEDVYFMEINSEYNVLKIPKVDEVLSFSWDRHPAFLYEKLNKLPFACHAWYREDTPYEENKTFWFQQIQIKQ